MEKELVAEGELEMVKMGLIGYFEGILELSSVEEMIKCIKAREFYQSILDSFKDFKRKE